MDEVRLEFLAQRIGNCRIKLKSEFFRKLLIDASGSEKPHLNRTFANKIGCKINKHKKKAMGIYAWMTKNKAPTLLRLSIILQYSEYSWKDIEQNFISLRSGPNRGEISPDFPIKLDEKIGSLVGHILGDGSIEQRFRKAFYSNKNPELLEEFYTNMGDILGVVPRIWVQKPRSFEEKSEWLMRVASLDDVPTSHCVGLFCPKICSDILLAIFGNFAVGKKKCITEQIFSANKNVKKGLVRAFFDDEGSIRSDSHTMRLHQDNSALLSGIKALLSDLGVNSHKIRTYYKREKPRHYFNVCGFKEYYAFYKEVGCTSSRKQNEFEKLINKVAFGRGFKRKYALPATSYPHSRAVLPDQAYAAFG